MTRLQNGWSCRKTAHVSKIKDYKVSVLLKMLSVFCLDNEPDPSMIGTVTKIIFINVRFYWCHIPYECQFLHTYEFEILTVRSCAFDTKLCQDWAVVFFLDSSAATAWVDVILSWFPLQEWRVQSRTVFAVKETKHKPVEKFKTKTVVIPAFSLYTTEGVYVVNVN